MVEVIIPVDLLEEGQNMLLTSGFEDMVDLSEEAILRVKEALDANQDPFKDELLFLVGASSVFMKASVDGLIDIIILNDEQIQKTDAIIGDIMPIIESQRDALSAGLGENADGFFAVFDANHAEYNAHVNDETIITPAATGPDTVIEEQAAPQFSPEDVLYANLLGIMQNSDDARDIISEVADVGAFVAMLESRTDQEIANLLSPDEGSEYDVVKGSLVGLMQHGATKEEYAQLYTAFDNTFDRIEGTPDFNAPWVLNHLVSTAQTQSQLDNALDGIYHTFSRNGESMYDVITENPNILARVFENKPGDFDGQAALLTVMDFSGIESEGGVERLIESLKNMPETTGAAQAIEALNTVLNTEAAAEMAQGEVSYHVKPGDTLAYIAQNYADVTWQEIADRNGITDPRTLKENTTLYIPSTGVDVATVEVNVEVAEVEPVIEPVVVEPLIQSRGKAALEGPESAMSAAESSLSMAQRSASFATDNSIDPLAPTVLEKAEQPVSEPVPSLASLELDTDPLAPTAMAREDEGSTVTYTIQGGDTLGLIAKANGTSVQSLMDANPQIENKDRIYPGDPIQIPRPEAAPVAAEAVALSEPSDYLIKRGDTLDEIADSKGTTTQAIMDINPEITNKNLIIEGATIKIPGQALPIEPPKDNAPTTFAEFAVAPNLPTTGM